MKKREAFRQLSQEFIAHISRYENSDPEFFAYASEKIDEEIPKFERSVCLNKLPPATFAFTWYDKPKGSPWPSLLMSDVGGRRLFFEITSQPRFDEKLDEEMPDVAES